jgi:hypothetical protein
MKTGLTTWGFESPLEIEGAKDGIIAVGILTGITLRGVVIETAESGARVVLDSTNGLRGIASSGAVQWQGATDGHFYLDSITDYSTKSVQLTLAGGLGSLLFSGGVYGLWVDARTSPVKLFPTCSALTYADLVLSGYLNTDSVIFNGGGGEIARINSKGLSMLNVASEPSAPAAGGILYTYGGALKYISAGGTRTVVAPN